MTLRALPGLAITLTTTSAVSEHSDRASACGNAGAMLPIQGHTPSPTSLLNKPNVLNEACENSGQVGALGQFTKGAETHGVSLYTNTACALFEQVYTN